MSHGKVIGSLLFVIATSAGFFAVWNYSAQSVPNLNAAPLDMNVSKAATKSDRLPIATSVDLSRNEEPSASDDLVAAYAMALKTTAVEPPRVELPKPVVENPGQTKRLLNDAQIASIKSRLKLTQTQSEYWPAVEAALREVVLKHGAAPRGKASPHTATRQIGVDRAKVQRLTAAAVPLIMRLREDQHELRTLARLIGLNTVASQI